MSYKRFASIINGYGGSVSCQFCQNDYLAEFSGIRAKRLSSLRSTVVNSNFTGMDGMCLGFSLFMIEKHFNFPSFVSALSTGEGKGKVRGYMFVQHLTSITTTGKATDDESIYANLDGEDMSLAKNIAEAAAMALANKFDKTGEQSSSKWGVYGSALFIRDKPNHYFHVGIYGHDGGHAIALVHTENRYGIFDPNYGLGMLPKEGRGSTRNFCRCMDDYIKTLYYGGLSGSHHITSYKSKLRPITTMRF
ncbi:YopT-type cysteine protease domain-containing protein [Kistimonas asteriae]|uniref:YopT-type cysteine protease domain-containing protein n=1 Tax=Kistimonas asteriae TaxID=517724 RepID=UPI001BAB93CB|nr:YopT-type cysteine protease domain-containing protein [Kistimonas asteriae]